MLKKAAFVAFWLIMNIQPTKASFNGKIVMDSTWQKVAYLSLLPSFDDMYTLNKDFVVAEAKLSTDGTFTFNTEFLPKHDALYRVHFVKKGDPVATLIMGGQHENHFFFVGSRSDSIQMLLNSVKKSISETKILGFGVNYVIAQINNYKKAFYEINGENTALKAQLLDLAYQEQLKQIADSTQYLMAGLYAIYQGNVANSQNTDINKAFIEKWQGNESPYFKEFGQKMKLPASTNYNMLWISIALIIGLSIGTGLSALWFKNKSETIQINDKESLLNELSVQEKKVHRLLENGLSNKEISNELNIGVNTVKSHVSSVLNKLKVKSRKELMV
jgi:DNA-binding CsgD family transcriptional regulator